MEQTNHTEHGININQKTFYTLIGLLALAIILQPFFTILILVFLS
jgi:hypothetical protein